MKTLFLIYFLFVALFAQTTKASSGLGQIKIDGLIEVEAVDEDSYIEDSSDIQLATVALGFYSNVNEKVDAHIRFLFEEDKTEFGIDEAAVDLRLSDVSTLTVGKLYLPFGSLESYMISDPLVLGLGETNETIVRLGFQPGPVAMAAYFFDGDILADSGTAEDKADNYGLSFSCSSDTLNLGVDYLSNVADSDVLQDFGSAINNNVAALSLHFHLRLGGFIALAEYTSALDEFIAGDFGGQVTTAVEPVATNLELGYEASDGRVIVLSVQSTDESAAFEFPETAIGVTYSVPVLEGAGFAIEYMSLADYTDDEASVITLQLGYEF